MKIIFYTIGGLLIYLIIGNLIVKLYNFIEGEEKNTTRDAVVTMLWPPFVIAQIFIYIGKLFNCLFDKLFNFIINDTKEKNKKDDVLKNSVKGIKISQNGDVGIGY